MTTWVDLEEIMSRGTKRSPKDRPRDSTYTRDLSAAGLREADPSVEDAGAGEGSLQGAEFSSQRSGLARWAAQSASSEKRFWPLQHLLRECISR